VILVRRCAMNDLRCGSAFSLVALAVAVLTALVVVPVATAEPPDRNHVPAPGDVTITDQCAFPVLGHIAGGEIDATFFDKAGIPVKEIGVFPGQTLTVANLETGTSITLVNAGSFQARAQRDGSVTISITGRGPIPNIITGEPGIWYLDGGHVLLTIDADGNLASIETTGNLVDLCDQLAG
jgi:hypothetical protein